MPFGKIVAGNRHIDEFPENGLGIEAESGNNHAMMSPN